MEGMLAAEKDARKDVPQAVGTVNEAVAHWANLMAV